jgi:hypothetical protein
VRLAENHCPKGHGPKVRLGDGAWRCRPCHNAKLREYYKNNPRPLRRYDPVTGLQKKWGLTMADLDAMLEAQGGVCAICKGVDWGHRRASIDHCHKTGQIRGLLCHKCNIGLGHYNDDPELLIAAAQYLKERSQ